MKKTQHCLCALVSAVVLSLTPLALGSEIHAILVIDTNDPFIGKSVGNDMLHYQEFLTTVSEQTDQTVHEMVFSGDDFISDNVYDYVQNLKIEPDDTIVFYYSGHGYRTDTKDTQWPAMHFGFHQLGLDLHDVVELIVEKSPRFAVVMSDTCNGFEEEAYAPSWDRRSLLTTRPDDPKKIRLAYQTLFLDNDVLIISTSSEPGQYSYGPNSGGIYTNAFLKSFYFEVKQNNPSWKRLLERAQKKVNKIEHPLFDITPLG